MLFVLKVGGSGKICSVGSNQTTSIHPSIHLAMYHVLLVLTQQNIPTAMRGKQCHHPPSQSSFFIVAIPMTIVMAGLL